MIGAYAYHSDRTNKTTREVYMLNVIKKVEVSPEEMKEVMDNMEDDDFIFDNPEGEDSIVKEDDVHSCRTFYITQGEQPEDDDTINVIQYNVV